MQQCLVTRQVHLRHPWVGYSCWSFSNRCSLRLASLPLCGAYHSVIPGTSTTCKQIAILILRCNTLGWFRLQHAPRRVLLIVPISSLLSVFKLIVRITISQRRACERGSIACCPYEGRSSKFGLGGRQPHHQSSDPIEVIMNDRYAASYSEFPFFLYTWWRYVASRLRGTMRRKKHKVSRRIVRYFKLHFETSL